MGLMGVAIEVVAHSLFGRDLELSHIRTCPGLRLQPILALLLDTAKEYILRRNPGSTALQLLITLFGGSGYRDRDGIWSC